MFEIVRTLVQFVSSMSSFPLIFVAFPVSLLYSSLLLFLLYTAAVPILSGCCFVLVYTGQVDHINGLVVYELVQSTPVHSN